MLPQLYNRTNQNQKIYVNKIFHAYKTVKFQDPREVQIK